MEEVDGNLHDLPLNSQMVWITVQVLEMSQYFRTGNIPVPQVCRAENTGVCCCVLLCVLCVNFCVYHLPHVIVMAAIFVYVFHLVLVGIRCSCKLWLAVQLG